MFKNKKVLIGVVVAVVVIILAGGGLFILGNKQAQKAPADQQQTTQDENIPTISSEELGLSLTAREDNKAVKIVIGKANDIKSFDYDLTYDANIPASEAQDGGDPNAKVTQNIHGEGVKPNGSSWASDYLILGTCSSGTCRYDTGISSVKLTLKVTKSDNKVYQAEQSLTL